MSVCLCVASLAEDGIDLVLEKFTLDGHLVLLERVLGDIVCVCLVHLLQYGALLSDVALLGGAQQELHAC